VSIHIIPQITKFDQATEKKRSTINNTMAFLIPFGVVGYKMWQHHKREEAKKAEALVSVDPITILQDEDAIASSEDDSPSCSSESSTDTPFEKGRSPQQPDKNDADEKEGKERRSPLKDILKFLAFEKSHDPFRIRTNDEALTYEVMGNKGDNALPFPKISYR
jgi:hypothetical protein